VKKRVVIGLSGGVDSSVAAWALKESGYDVAGLFMRNWHDTTGLLQSDCHWEDDLMFAEMVARKLDIPFHFIDLSEPYRKRVVDYMFSEYGKGRTPNPDILCNREIKFDSFADEARKLGGDYVATGHYCRKDTIISDNGNINRLLKGMDQNKDQSYFLCQVSQEQLGFSLFPIGDLTKPEVRKIADRLGLATAHRKDSQGICFVGKVHLPTFLQQKLEAKSGQIIAHFFTIGQRKGIKVGGYKEPLFVLGIDIENNVLYVGEGHQHPGLYRKGLFIGKDEVHWIRRDLEMTGHEVREYDVRIRYRQPLQKAKLYKRNNGIYIVFNKLQRGVAPGQFAAWYDGEELIGSGVISS
jgi:tRNA-specific 2-thiouridylase